MTLTAGVVLALAAALIAGFAAGTVSAAVRYARRARRAEVLVLRDELLAAPGHGQFVLHYQPKVELSTGRVTALEALVRWQHPIRGLLMPPEFLPIAGQHSELMASLTCWVVRRALTDQLAWTATGHDWTVAVNTFATNLGSPEFVDSVDQMLAETGVQPGRLRLEVNHAELALDPARVMNGVEELVARGVSLSIDDFGVGDTNRAELSTLHLSELKIDPSLIAALPGRAVDRDRVRSLVALGHGLGCSVTAVGVETQEVAEWLASAGCDHGQGYLWLRPRAWNEVTQVFDDASRAG